MDFAVVILGDGLACFCFEICESGRALALSVGLVSFLTHIFRDHLILPFFYLADFSFQPITVRTFSFIPQHYSEDDYTNVK